MCTLTRMEHLFESREQRVMFNAYHGTVIESVLTFVVTEFYRRPMSYEEFKKWVQPNIDNYMDMLIDSIETTIYEDIDMCAISDPNLASTLISMVDGRWGTDSSFLNYIIKQRVLDLLFPVYMYLSQCYFLGFCLDYESFSIISDITLEVTLKVTSEDVINDSYYPIAGYQYIYS